MRWASERSAVEFARDAPGRQMTLVVAGALVLAHRRRRLPFPVVWRVVAWWRVRDWCGAVVKMAARRHHHHVDGTANRSRVQSAVAIRPSLMVERVVLV